MKKHLLEGIALLLGLWALAYLACAAIEWKADPAEWDTASRHIAAVFCMVWAIGVGWHTFTTIRSQTNR